MANKREIIFKGIYILAEVSIQDAIFKYEEVTANYKLNPIVSTIRGDMIRKGDLHLIKEKWPKRLYTQSFGKVFKHQKKVIKYPYIPKVKFEVYGYCKDRNKLVTDLIKHINDHFIIMHRLPILAKINMTNNTKRKFFLGEM
jgi:hypothetical protein